MKNQKESMVYMAQAAVQFKQLEHIEANGNDEEVTYIFKHPGVRAGVQLRERCKDSSGQMDGEKFYEELMKRIIVKPKTNWDYWELPENEGHFNSTMKAASTFLYG